MTCKGLKLKDHYLPMMCKLKVTGIVDHITNNRTEKKLKIKINKIHKKIYTNNTRTVWEFMEYKGNEGNAR